MNAATYIIKGDIVPLPLNEKKIHECPFYFIKEHHGRILGIIILYNFEHPYLSGINPVKTSPYYPTICDCSKEYFDKIRNYQITTDKDKIELYYPYTNFINLSKNQTYEKPNI